MKTTLKDTVECVQNYLYDWMMINCIQNTEGDYFLCVEHFKRLWKSITRVLPLSNNQVMSLVNPVYDIYIDQMVPSAAELEVLS